MKRQTITEEMRYRLSLIKYARKNGVSKTARIYKTNRQYIYRWLNRYDGDIRSLANKSTRPKSHPNMHPPEEIKLIKDMYAKNKNTGLVTLWVKLQQRGYTRSISSLYRNMIKLGLTTNVNKKKKTKKKTKPYEQMTFPGERIQIDVKTVPKKCVHKDINLYQYTAID